MQRTSSNKAFAARHFLAPRYWATWIGLAAMWCIAQLPYPWQLRLGELLGRIMKVLLRRRRHIAAVNLRLSFPALNNIQRRALLNKHFESLGISLVETAMSWWTPDSRLRPLATVEGLEYLQKALTLGKGVILLSAHFTTLEIGTHLLAMQTRFHAMYRAHKNLLFEEVMRRSREARCQKAIARDDIRGLLRSLKENIPVWYASDQNYGHKHSIFAPFFGVQAATNTAPVRLAKISKAPIIPFFIERLPGRKGYHLALQPALENIPSGNIEKDIVRINQLIEAHILKVPEQYLWVHRRFKDRPAGQSDFYNT